MAGKTSSKAAKAASRVLSDENASEDARTAAASALAQTEPEKGKVSPLSAETIVICRETLNKLAAQFPSKGHCFPVAEGRAYATVDKGKGFVEVVTKDGTFEAARI